VFDLRNTQSRLVIEVDGGYHRARRQADARRDEKLRRGGWRVLRIEAEHRNLPEVLRRIREAI
jgi:very-short-patch-repair endonuclease